jgi:serralysin
MPSLQFVTYETSATALETSQITDLEIVDTAAGPVLYATTRYDGAITAWSIDGTDLVVADTSNHRRNDAPGAEADLAVIETATGMALLTGGGGSGTLSLHAINADGSLGAVSNLGTVSAFAADLIGTVTVQLSDGTQVVYGGLSGTSGIGQLSFSATGSLTGSTVTADSASTHADQVTALAHAAVGGSDYLFTVSATEGGVTAWQIGPGGGLSAVSSIDADDGLWIAAPTGFEVLTVGAQTFLVLAAAGTSSLTVIAVGTNGSLSVTDHVIDGRDTRFEGVTTLATVVHDGQSYVIAGGADDGISLFHLLPNGQLLHLAAIEDTTGMGLANVSAVAAQSGATGIDIFVASGSETGITRLLYQPPDYALSLTAATVGATLTGSGSADMLAGGAGADRLSGGGGADILIDGAGSDTLSGGTGADIFVLVADGSPDTITDFEVGVDRLDLSAWPLLRDVTQLTLTQTATGLSIAYLDEVLILTSSNGRPINPSSLGNADILSGGSHLAPVPLSSIEVDPDPPPGSVDPDTPQVTPPDPPPPGTEDVLGSPQNDVLTAPAGGAALYGQNGADTLTGSGSADSLYGEAGDDWLFGGGGNDLLDGGTGRDRMEGGTGNDIYHVDNASDLVIEAANGGTDTVRAWVNYTVPAHVEVLRLQGEANLAAVGTDAPEALVGQSGANVLRGMGGNDVLTAKAGNDILIGGPGMDWLVGDPGADVFVYEALSDSLPGIANRDLINGFENGIDRIDLSAIDANPDLSGNQAFTFIGGAAFTHGTVGQLRFHTWGQGNDYGIVEADVNGDGRADFQIFINQTDVMFASDFIL